MQHAAGANRKTGCGYSLALNTGGGTHLTLVYFNNAPRGYTQDLIKPMATDYFEQQQLTHVDLVATGEGFNERSVRITGRVEAIVTDLAKLFASFDIDQNQVPHIDLRGKGLADVQLRQLPLTGNFVH